jgi:hypothetical protein
MFVVRVTRIRGVSKTPSNAPSPEGVLPEGTRVPAKTLVDYVKAGHTLDDFLEGFPTVRREAPESYLEMTLEAADLASSAR